MKILRRLYYPYPGALNKYNFGVVPFLVDHVEEGELVRVLNKRGDRVDVAKRYGSRDGMAAYIGYGALTVYVEQEDAKYVKAVLGGVKYDQIIIDEPKGA